MTDPPIFINCRDRVTHLRGLVDWLERAGHERIVLLDNASTYEPLLEFYASTPHQVVRFRTNVGSRAIWNAERVPAEPFVYTDPDIIPTADCPLDAVARLAEALERHPSYPKAGLGLYLDDVPATLPSLDWERDLVADWRELEPGVFASLVDTTFALYRPAAGFAYEGLRLGAPYQARHMPWYVTVPDAEDRYYLEHAIAGPLGSIWAAHA